MIREDSWWEDRHFTARLTKGESWIYKRNIAGILGSSPNSAAVIIFFGTPASNLSSFKSAEMFIRVFLLIISGQCLQCFVQQSIICSTKLSSSFQLTALQDMKNQYHNLGDFIRVQTEEEPVSQTGFLCNFSFHLPNSK